SGGAARAARVHPDAYIPVGYPLLGVRGLPVLILVSRPGQNLWILGGQCCPHAWEPGLKGQPLGVRAMRHDHWVAAVVHWAEHVRPERHAVLHPYRHVPLDSHAVADFAHILSHGLVSFVACTQRYSTDASSSLPSFASLSCFRGPPPRQLGQPPVE